MMTFSMSVVDRSTRLELEAEEEENAMSAKELEEAKKREKEEQAKKVKTIKSFYCQKPEHISLSMSFILSERFS